ncbi:MAG: TIGR01212 family radical SAM protein [Tannerella sp.]|jgi:radical SAM protein (TIGR01212 family)|nr:TIGR01212 family radical SAM protein [Tannerella sp.]
MDTKTIPYYSFGDFLKKRFPFKVQKISVNAGFTCPNRDGTKGVGGCTYCNNDTFHPAYCGTEKSISTQLEEGIRFFARKYPEMKYLAYFQAYTNSYASLETLRQKYEEALAFPGVTGLIIGTRPDCMPDVLLDYLAGKAAQAFILVEYGVESASDGTLQRINRGHTWQESVDTIRRTHAKGIAAGAHLLLGLPGEEREQMLHLADLVSALPLTVVKLHQLQIIRHTALEKEFREHPGHFRLFSPEEYVDFVIDFLERLPPEMAVDRFVSQSPKELLIAPDWGLKNHEFTALVHKRFAARRTRQGARYQPSLICKS